MRWTRSAAALAAMLLLGAPAQAGSLFGVWGLVGNDTGGIIPWSPQNELARHAIASQHCAWYGKIARISSVHRQYGDYIGFHCLFPPSMRATRDAWVRLF
jgi:hypothetical protein